MEEEKKSLRTKYAEEVSQEPKEEEGKKKEMRGEEKIYRYVVLMKIIITPFENRIKMQENRISVSICQTNKVSRLG